MKGHGALDAARVKPQWGGIFVDSRSKPVHKMTEAQVRKEMVVFSLVWVETMNGLPLQHIIVFRKPAGTGVTLADTA